MASKFLRSCPPPVRVETLRETLRGEEESSEISARDTMRSGRTFAERLGGPLSRFRFGILIPGFLLIIRVCIVDFGVTFTFRVSCLPRNNL